MNIEERTVIEAVIRGWFKSDMATETFFGYFGRCDPEGAAKDITERIVAALSEQAS